MRTRAPGPPRSPRPPDQESHDDYAPSFSVDGKTVVFNRDNQGIYTEGWPIWRSRRTAISTILRPGWPPPRVTTGRPAGSSSTRPSRSTGLRGRGQPHSSAERHSVTFSPDPCPTQTSLTDTDLSATATGNTAPADSGRRQPGLESGRDQDHLRLDPFGWTQPVVFHQSDLERPHRHRPLARPVRPPRGRPTPNRCSRQTVRPSPTPSRCSTTGPR